MQAYLAQPSPFDESLTVLDFMREQLGGAGAPDMQTISATVQGILDMSGSAFVCGNAALVEVQDCLVCGVWPPLCFLVTPHDPAQVDGATREDECMALLQTVLVQSDPAADCPSFSVEAQHSAIACSLSAHSVSGSGSGGGQSALEVARAARDILVLAADYVASVQRGRSALGDSLKTSEGQRTQTRMLDHNQLHLCPCRYWLHSSCLRRACPFKHDLGILPCDLESAVGPTEGLYPIESYDVFPGLPSAKEATPAAPSADVGSAGESEGEQSKSAEAASLLLGKFHLQARAPPTLPTENTATSCARALPGRASAPGGGGTRGVPRIDEWLEGGKAVAGLYAATRGEATALAQSRNALFEKSAALYRAGKKKEASAVSSQGREVNERLLAVQSSAAKHVFSARNSEAGLLKGSIDLHGLHVAEAEDCLQNLLPTLALAGRASVSVVTGSGNHSRGGGGGGGQARLLPAVQKLCSDMGLPWQPIVVHGFTGGVLVDVASLGA